MSWFAAFLTVVGGIMAAAVLFALIAVIIARDGDYSTPEGFERKDDSDDRPE